MLFSQVSVKDAAELFGVGQTNVQAAKTARKPGKRYVDAPLRQRHGYGTNEGSGSLCVQPPATIFLYDLRPSCGHMMGRFLLNCPRCRDRRPERSHRQERAEITPEEHKQRDDAADTLFRDMKRRIAEKARPS